MDREQARRARLPDGLAIEAESKQRSHPEALDVFDLLLFLEDGWLAILELVHYADAVVGRAELPPPSDFEPPRARLAGTDPGIK